MRNGRDLSPRMLVGHFHYLPTAVASAASAAADEDHDDDARTGRENESQLTIDTSDLPSRNQMFDLVMNNPYNRK